MIQKKTVYLPVKVEENRTDTPSSVPKEKWGVHEAHCCKKHGCKYGDEDCPIVLGHAKQRYTCDDGYDDCFREDVELKTQEGYFFTPDQLNEYTANVIKQALLSASEFAELQYECGNKSKEKCLAVFCNNCTEQIDRQSITNTFEETFKKFEV